MGTSLGLTLSNVSFAYFKKNGLQSFPSDFKSYY